LAKRKKVSSPPAPKAKKAFDPEDSPLFAPIAFAVIFVALLVLFRDFIFSHKMLYGSDTIQAGIFFRSFLVDYFKEHWSVPQWNPYIFCGMPYVEAFHGDIFYPLSVLKFFGSIYRMLGINLFLHIFMAGFFMYLTARQFKLSKIASLMSGVCYMFASYLVSMVAPGHDGKIFVTTLFPLVILFLDRVFERRAFLNASLMGLVLGVIVLSPHPQMSYFALWAAAFYTIFKLAVMYREKKTLVSLVRPAALAAYAVIIGLLLSAIQFYPGYIYTSHFSPRADSKSGWEWATSWSMHEEEAFSLIIPEFCGTSSSNVKTYYWGKNAFKDNSESIGVVAIFVGLIGLFFSRRRERWFFGGLALFALFYALGATTPVFKLFYYLIPKVKSLRAPSMIMFLFSFSTAILAGFGVQHLIDVRRGAKKAADKRFNYLLFGVPVLMLALAFLFSVAGRAMMSFWSSLFYSDAATTFIQKGFSKLDVAYLNLPAIQSGAWLAFLFTVVAALLIWLYRSRRAGIGLLIGLALVPVVNGVRFDSRFIRTFDQNRVWAPNAFTEFFRQHQGHYRVMSFSPVVQPDLLPFHHVEMVTGYHGNQLRWYDELLGGIGAKHHGNPRLLNLTGARYLLMPADRQLPPEALGAKPLSIATTFGSIQVMQNDNAFPRVYLVDRYHLFADRRDIYPEVLNGSEDLRKIVYLEEEPEISIVPDTLGTESDSAWIIDYATDSVLVGLSCSHNELLVLTDNWYDAWHVYVDGAPAKLLRAYGSFRAVAIPRGTEKVLFEYNSERYRLGRLVTWLTSLYLIVILAFSLIWSRTPKTPEKGTG